MTRKCSIVKLGEALQDQVAGIQPVGNLLSMIALSEQTTLLVLVFMFSLIVSILKITKINCLTAKKSTAIMPA
jgi:hypothetical protein